MCDQQKSSNNSSIFIMGLILGAIIAGVIVLTSADDKAKIIKKIKNKFNELFGETHKTIKKKRAVIPQPRDITPAAVPEVSKKISVDIPSDVETLNLTPIKEPKPKMVFMKSK